MNNYGVVTICKNCGLEVTNNISDTSTNITDICNVNDKGHMAIKIVGKGSYSNMRSMIKTCSNYKQYSNNNALRQITNLNNTNNKHSVPKKALSYAHSMFVIIKTANYVYRKSIKDSVIAACIYYGCCYYHISRTPSEISSLCGIKEKQFSNGDKILRELNELGVIKLPNNVNPLVDYVRRYMEKLTIDKKYEEFVTDIIECAEKKYIHIIHNSKSQTKAIGAIYILIERVPELNKVINNDIIAKECCISKSTFKRYRDTIYKYYKKFKWVFKKHHISMPRNWRDNVVESTY